IRLAARIAGLAIEHAQAETALQNSEEKYRSLVESSDSIIVVFDEAGTLQFANEIAAAQLGFTSKSIVGQHMVDFFAPTTAEQQLSAVRRVISSGMGVVTESPSEFAGDVHWYRTSVQPIRNAAGGIISALVHASDITQFKVAEASLRQSEARYRQMFERVNLPKMIIDPVTARILDANRAAVEFYGYPLETLKTMTMMEINVASPEVIRAKINRILKQEIQSCPFEQRLADGSLRDVEVYSTQVDHDGQQVLYSLFIDVTERNQAQAALRVANQELEQRVQERTSALEKAKDRVEAIFNHSGDGILLLDAALNIQQGNHAFDQMFAMAGDEYFHQPLWQFVQAADRAQLQAITQEVVQLHVTRRIESRVQSRRGSSFDIDIEISIAPVNRSEHAVENIVGIIRDISERKRAERALRQSEERLQMMLTGTRAGTWEWFVQTGKTTFNERWAEIVGYTLDELAPISIDTWTRLAHPDDLQVSGQLLEKHFSGELGYYDCEARMKHKDGHWVWVWDRGMVLEWTPDGKPLRMLGTHVDITERKQVEAALAEERNLLRTVIDTVPDFIYVKNTQHEIILNNKSHAELIGSRAQDAVKPATHLDGLAPELQEAIRASEALVIATGTGLYNVENQTIRPDGSRLWTSTTKVPLCNLNREVIGIVGITSDISHLKQHEMLLRKSEEQYRLTVEAMSEGLVVQDADGAIRLCNSAAENILGLTAEQMVGRKSIDPRWRSIHEDGSPFPGEDHPAMVTLRTGRPQSNIIMGVHKPDDSLTWIEISTRLITTADDRLQVVATFTDITEQRRAKEALAEERNLLRTVIDTVPDFIYVKDTQHRMILNNTAHRASLGAVSPEEVIGKTDFELFPADLAAKFEADEQILFETETAVTRVEERSIGVHGGDIWGLTTKVPLRNIQGELVGLVGITHDVTELKAKEEALRRSEQQLRESQNMLRLVLDTIPVRVFWKDRDSVYLGCNQLFAQDAGLPDSTAIIGKRDSELPWLAAETDSYRRDDLAVIESGIPKLDYEETQRTARGDNLILQTYKLPLRDADGQIIGVLGAYLDITQRKQAELALAEKSKAEREMQHYLAALHKITLRLTRIETLDEFYYLTVAEGMKQFGFERMGFLLHDESDGSVVGTYGTDPQGSVVPDHSLHIRPEHLTGILRRTLDRAERFAFDEEAQLFANLKPIGVGQNAAVALWNGKLLGWLAIDNGVHHRPITKAQLDILALYALTVGSLLARKSTELALRESEQRYRLLAENIRDVIVKVSMDGVFTFVSPSSYELTRHMPEELIGVPVMATVHPDDVADAMAAIAQAMQSRSTFFSLQQRIAHKDGHYVWVEVTNTVVVDSETGEPLEMIGILHDISERKAAEEALRESEARYQSVVQTQTELICRYLPDFTLSFVNNAYCRYFGKEPAELIGHSWLELVPEPLRPQFKAEREALMRARGAITLEMPVAQPDGIERWMSWTDQVILDSRNQVVAVQAVGI
ncbi:MAG: PAS domain S-box protein, partial [Anaerolineae bacterium]|nr:PAS domain S-box protein [Anaerolineae bacterium]